MLKKIPGVGKKFQGNQNAREAEGPEEFEVNFKPKHPYSGPKRESRLNPYFTKECKTKLQLYNDKIKLEKINLELPYTSIKSVGSEENMGIRGPPFIFIFYLDSAGQEQPLPFEKDESSSKAMLKIDQKLAALRPRKVPPNPVYKEDRSVPVKISAKDLYLALSDLSLKKFMEGQYKSAIALCDAMSVIQPQYPVPHQNKGRALMKLNRFGDAAIEFAVALQLKPGDGTIISNLEAAKKAAGTTRK